MSRQETLLISAIVRSGNIKTVTRQGVDSQLFTTYKDEMEWLESQPSVPSRSVFAAQFPDFPIRRVKADDIPAIIGGLRENWLKTQTARLVQASAKRLSQKKKKLTAESILTDLSDEVSVLLEKTSVGGVTEIVTEGGKFLREFRIRQKNHEKGVIEGVSTGIPAIDRYTGGLLPSRLYFVIARQGQGKTYFMLRWAAEALLAGKRVLWISREMPDDMVAYRIHSIMSTLLRGPDNSFSNLGLILGREDVDYKDYASFLRHMRKTVKGRLFIPENRKVHVKNMAYYIDRYNVDISFYDYIGLLGQNEGNRGWQELGFQAAKAKEDAMEYKIPVVMAAQVNRAATKDGNEEAPMVENIALSDQLGYAADQVFSLSMSKNISPQGKRIIEVWVRKQRYGQNDINVQVEFDGDRGHLAEVPDSLQGVTYFDPKEAKKEKDRKRGHRKLRRTKSDEITESKKTTRSRRKRSTKSR